LTGFAENPEGGISSFGMEEEIRKEKEAERVRGARFSARFPRAASLPLVGQAFGAAYRHGLPYLLLVLASIILFTAVKGPYLAAPFTGEHSMKYNTYVEPAQHMRERGSMLWYQKKYIADPVHNPEGILRKFDHLPLMEWGLYLTYTLLPNAGIEFGTRLFTHVIGVLILLYAYLFFCRYFPKRYCVLLIALLAINPVVSFATYVTVLDSIVLLFMFLSLRQLALFHETGRVSLLVWAGVWFGLGNAVKYPLFLWLAPVAFLYLYFLTPDTVSFLKNYLIYVGLSLLITFAAVAIAGRLLSATGWAAFLLVPMMAGLFLVRYALERYDGPIRDAVRTVWENRWLLALVSLGSIAVGIVILRLLRLNEFADEFLTDSTLIGNYRLYKYMLLQQFKNYMTRNLFWLGLAGAALAIAVKENAMRRIWIPFAFGSLVYWVAASKAIFFHIYYTLIIVLTLTMSAAYFIHAVEGKFGSRVHRWVVLLGFFALILPPALDATGGRMKNFVNVDQVVKFIDENTAPDDLILFEGYLTPLAIYTGRGFVMPAVLIDNAVRDSIGKIGFADTMRKYKVRYLFTPNEQPFYLDYAPVFESTGIIEPSGTNFNRNITIYKTLGIRDPGVAAELKEAKEIEERHRIREKFVPASRIGRFQFYSFRN